MASLQTGAKDRRRESRDDLLRHAAASAGVSPRGPEGLAPAKEVPAVRAARELSERIGDVGALEATPVPSLDYMCLRENGVSGRMYCQAGLCFCRWE